MSSHAEITSPATSFPVGARPRRRPGAALAVPMLVGLDLRAKVGADNVGRERILALIEQYGADTVNAVMNG